MLFSVGEVSPVLSSRAVAVRRLPVGSEDSRELRITNRDSWPTFLLSLLIPWLIAGLAGCGSVTFVSGTLPPVHRNVLTVSGFVSNINFAVVNDRGTMVDVTPVSFEQQSGAVLTVSFCGAIGDQFFMGLFTTVDYSQATNSACATVVRVVNG